MENFKIFWNEGYFLRHNFTKQRVRGSHLSRWKETKAHRDTNLPNSSGREEDFYEYDRAQKIFYTNSFGNVILNSDSYMKLVTYMHHTEFKGCHSRLHLSQLHTSQK